MESGEYDFWIGESSADTHSTNSRRLTVSGVWNAPLSAVTVRCEKSLLTPGEEKPLSLTATLMDAQHLDTSSLPFQITSSDEAVVRVENGRLIAQKPGAVRITARLSMNGVTAEDSIGLCVVEK